MIINPSDWDNDDTDDPDYWDADDEYWEDGSHVDTCPWCGSIFCAFLNNDGQLECCATKRIIP